MDIYVEKKSQIKKMPGEITKDGVTLLGDIKKAEIEPSHYSY